MSVPVYVHHVCTAGEVLGTAYCDCVTKWQESVDHVVRSGKGVAVCVRRPGVQSCAAKGADSEGGTLLIAQQIMTDLHSALPAE